MIRRVQDLWLEWRIRRARRAFVRHPSADNCLHMTDLITRRSAAQVARMERQLFNGGNGGTRSAFPFPWTRRHPFFEGSKGMS